MAGEQTNVVIAPNSETPSTSSTPSNATPEATPIVAQAITQAQDFGAMTVRFQQTQEELQQTRLELQMLKDQIQSNQSLTQSELTALQAKHDKLLQAIQEDEEDTETQSQENLNGVTVVTPPATVIPTTPEVSPMKKQSRVNRLLFGNDDDDV